MYSLQLFLGLCFLALEDLQDVAPADQVIQLLRRKVALGDQALQPRQLLGNIVGILLHLLANLVVVLCILVLRLASLLVELVVCLVTTVRSDGLHSGVEAGNDAGCGIEETACRAVGAGLLVDEGDEVGFRAAARVGFAVLGSLGEELDRGVRLDAVALGGGFGGFTFAVDEADGDVGFGGEVLGNLLPGGLQALAVCVVMSVNVLKVLRCGYTYDRTMAQ